MPKSSVNASLSSYSGIALFKIIFPLNMARAQAEAIQNRHAPSKLSPSAGRAATCASALPVSAARGTPLYTSVCSSTSAQTGAERLPPAVVQLWGSSRQTRHKNCGSSMGATATKLAMRAFSSALSSFWLVPLLPPTR